MNVSRLVSLAQERRSLAEPDPRSTQSAGRVWGHGHTKMWKWWMPHLLYTWISKNLPWLLNLALKGWLARTGISICGWAGLFPVIGYIDLAKHMSLSELAINNTEEKYVYNGSYIVCYALRWVVRCTSGQLYPKFNGAKSSNGFSNTQCESIRKSYRWGLPQE